MRELVENNLQKMAQKFQVLSEILEGCFLYLFKLQLFLKLFAPGICSRRFTASSYQRPLESFLIVHRTLAFCWLILEAAGSWIFFVLKNEAAIELAAAVFDKRFQQHGHEFRDEA